MKSSSAFFAPMIYLKLVGHAIGFYKRAFNVIVLTGNNEFNPGKLNGTTVSIGLFVNDPHAVVAKAVAAGGEELDPVRDYDYEYRQGCVKDPFGHHWLLEKKIG